MANESQDFMGQDQDVVHHISARKRRGLEPVSMNLNLTSMIDVIFLLLIYFVITANFAVGEGVLVAKGPSGSGSVEQTIKPPDQQLKIRISAGTTPAAYVIEVEGDPRRPGSFRELRQLLEELRYKPETKAGTYPSDSPVIITPQGIVPWQHVVNGFNAAIGARFTNVQFGTSDS